MTFKNYWIPAVDELIEIHEQEQDLKILDPVSIRRSNDGWDFHISPQFVRHVPVGVAPLLHFLRTLEVAFKRHGRKFLDTEPQLDCLDNGCAGNRLPILLPRKYFYKYKTLETLFYLIIGITPGYAWFYVREKSGLWELCIGGVVYITGVMFFKCDGRIPCAHAIWHLFVNIGATIHFYAVYTHLINADDRPKEIMS
ncbi:monocyte to macrophage differentiation factor 2 [Trichonephila clavipes]|nr:monocyte to macrophage differentiation factor 2 [Trichonephila clavipes]